MISSSAIAGGRGELHVGTVAGRSAVIRASARNPLRLLTPCSRRASVWAYASSFGGGLVAGDRTSLDVRIDSKALCWLSTQASTKVYRNPKRLPCSHELRAEIGSEALLVSAPDPVQCFAESSYEQRQSFQMAENAGLVMLDWISAGRTARGERWSFASYSSRNEIERAGRTIFIDSLLLDPKHGPLEAPFRMGRFNCLATLVVLGTRLQSEAGQILRRVGEQPIAPRADLLVAASPLQEGVVVRLAGESTEQVGKAIYEQIRWVADWLQDDPWQRKW